MVIIGQVVSEVFRNCGRPEDDGAAPPVCKIIVLLLISQACIYGTSTELNLQVLNPIKRFAFIFNRSTGAQKGKLYFIERFIVY